MVCAVVSGLVAEIEAQLFAVGCGAGFERGFEEGLLETEGALGEPMMLGHGGNQDFLGFGGWREFEV